MTAHLHSPSAPLELRQRFGSPPTVTRLVSAETAAAYAQRRSSEEVTEPSAERITEHVDVVLSERGLPVHLWWRERGYDVIAEPLRWFARRRWWAEDARAERGRAGLVSQEVWRIQIQDPCTAERSTVDLGRSVPAERWRLLRIHASPQETEAVE
ncbi:hypothetical protein [Nesterenkonia sphaerica]|uniref:hypothetical protein n=1 Tax=Nesterenkonia sphaerica TaxID=1804988 RepID=UPI001FB7FAC4|nr:hypothetical protein [Nesterenkonia sphaerica]